MIYQGFAMSSCGSGAQKGNLEVASVNLKVAFFSDFSFDNPESYVETISRPYNVTKGECNEVDPVPWTV